MKKISLMPFIELGGLETRFSTTPGISNRELLRFYDDFTKIIKGLDPEINYEGKIYLTYSRSFFWTLGIPFRYETIIKCLQVRNGNPEKFDIENVVRTYNILYHKNPGEFSDEEIARLKENMFGQFILERPNITITSTKSNYGSNDILARIKNLSYIEIPENFDTRVFNPRDIINIATGKKYSDTFLSPDGNIFTLNPDA